MFDLWSTLVPLIVINAIVPVQIAVTAVLVRSSYLTGSAWVAGTTSGRALQGLLFALVLLPDRPGIGDVNGHSPVVSTLLFVVGVLLLGMALRKTLADPAAEAAPPAWMARVETLRPSSAYLSGAAYMCVSPKFWIFTLGVVGAIADAELAPARATAVFLVFLALAQSGSLALLLIGRPSSPRAEEAIERLAGSLQRHSRGVTAVAGLVFGAWFIGKGLQGLGVW